MFSICSEMILGSNGGKIRLLHFACGLRLHEINTAHNVLVNLFEFGGSEVCVPCVHVHVENPENVLWL